MIDTSTPPSFGEWLKRQRRRMDLTQGELAKRAGCARVTIHKIESDDLRPSKQLAELLSQALDIAAEERDKFVQFARGAQGPEDWNPPEKGVPDLLNDLPPLRSPASGPSSNVGAVATHSAPLSGRSRRNRMVGRTEPLRRLERQLDQLLAGTGGTVLISGEPGIGKTRLLDETIAAAHSRGFQVLIGRCHERDVAIPYLPLSDALEVYARDCPPLAWARMLQAAGAEIGALLSDSILKYTPQFGGAVASSEKSAWLAARADARPDRAVRHLLSEMSRGMPVLLVIDDLHWGDPPTLELIHHLALHTREMPVLILGTYRELELERTHPLSKLLVDLNRERLLVRERLRRLSLAETQELVLVLMSGTAPEGLSELLHEQTEGNPFFVEELVDGLIGDARLVWSEQAQKYELSPGVNLERLAGQVPQGIRAAIGLRLDRLDPASQQVLGLASIIGRHFSLDLVKRLASAHGLSEEDVEQALERARDARFVTLLELPAERRDDIAGFSASTLEIGADHAFDHPLIHQVVYAESDRRRRRRLHTEVGHALEEIYHGRQSLYAERLAYHFLESDDDAKALQYSVMAGDKMMLAYYDADLALGYYLAALEMTVSREVALRHLSAKFPLPIRHGALHRFISVERDAVVAYLDAVLRTGRNIPATKAIAQLASRICVAAMHMGEVYTESIRLYEQSLLGPNGEKLVVQTERGTLVGILEFPSAGGPFPVVLMFHGSMSAKEQLADEAQRYLSRGLATLRVNLPGFGETTVPRTSSPADAEVLKDMVTAVLAHDRIDPRGVGVTGWSLGPWHAAQLCARDERVRAMSGISGGYDQLESLPGVMAPAALYHAFWLARHGTPEPPPWSLDSSIYAVAHRIRCPMLLVYGALEPDRYRVTAEKLARLVPTAKTKVWRSGVHILFNVPEALEDAAEWMKQQLLRAT